MSQINLCQTGMGILLHVIGKHLIPVLGLTSWDEFCNHSQVIRNKDLCGELSELVPV